MFLIYVDMHNPSIYQTFKTLEYIALYESNIQSLNQRLHFNESR